MAHVERSGQSDAPETPNRPDETSRNAGAEEGEIDQILADSFPASDAPPWTLGVAPAPSADSRPKSGDQRHRR
jgi:hypothetical protein